MKTLYRALVLVILNILKIKKILDIKFGSTHFRFKYVPYLKKYGGRGLFLQRQYLEDLLEYGDRFLRYGDVCIDGGANQGIYTVAFGHYVGPAGKVVAVEPMTYAIPLIENNCALNNIANVEIVNAGLSDEDGEATLDYNTGAGGASIVHNRAGPAKERIKCRTIDTLTTELDLNRVDFIKLDIEGAEEKALKGSRQTIAANHPIIVLESSEKQGKVDALQEELRHYGYEGFRMCGRTGELISKDDVLRGSQNVFFIPQHRIFKNYHAA